MDLISIVIATAVVLGVLLVVLAIIFFAVVLPPTRRTLALRRATDADEHESRASGEAAQEHP